MNSNESTTSTGVDEDIAATQNQAEATFAPDAAAQITELEDRLARTRADFDNYRRRVQKDLEDARFRAKSGVLEDLLPILDTFTMAQQAMDASNASIDVIRYGLDMIRRELDNVFSRQGISVLDCNGTPFDPNLHEAVRETAHDSIPEGHIVGQTRAGYRLGERLLRPATVIVSTGPAKPDDSPAGG